MDIMRNKNRLLALCAMCVLGSGSTAQAENYSLASSTPAAISSRAEGMSGGSAFIDSLQKTAANLKQYSLHYRMLVFKSKKKPQEETGVFYFKQPRLMRSEVMSGQRKGALAVLGADGKVRGHLGGMLKLFNATVSSDSQWAKLLNGYPMVNSDYLSLAAYLKNMVKSGNSSLVSREPVSNKHVTQKTYVLEVVHRTPTGDVLIKRVFVDPQSNLPVAWEDYTNGRLSALTLWSQVNLKADISDQTFKP